LFQWWTNRSGPRPLKSWVHVTGLVVGTNSWGWVIEGEAEHPERPHGQSKFIVQHPPWGELIQFGRIKSQADALTRQHSDLSDQEKIAHGRAHEVAAQENTNHARHMRSSAALITEGRNWQQTEARAREGLKAIDAQLKPLQDQLKSFTDSNHYKLDTFALETSLKVQGMPLYDHGVGHE
jgi:hypothetical protein